MTPDPLLVDALAMALAKSFWEGRLSHVEQHAADVRPISLAVTAAAIATASTGPYQSHARALLNDLAKLKKASKPASPKKAQSKR